MRSELPHRKNPRLADKDYSTGGVFFVTISSHEKQFIFGTINDQRMTLSHIGSVVESNWQALRTSFPTVTLDEFIVMPNHVHGVLAIDGSQPNPPALGTIIRRFKSRATAEVRRRLGDPEAAVWHRNYNDRIVRLDGNLSRVRQYIRSNVSNWPYDEDNPAAMRVLTIKDEF